MPVDLDKWKPGEDVDDDALVLEELRRFRSDDFDKDQKARVKALKASREVLSERSGSAFANTTKAVDTLDLVNVASWIINGKDPWKGIVINPGQGILNCDSTDEGNSND